MNKNTTSNWDKQTTGLTPQNSIGVFDSGFGGLTILRGLVKELPLYNYLYLGDTARAPYGNRSPEIIYDFTKQAVDFMFKNNCEIIIIACNTASSDALRRIQKEYLPKYYPDKKVLGVLIPAAEEAIIKTKSQLSATGPKKIGVIATEGTIFSGAFIRELKKLDSKVKIFQNACPLLVPIIEAGEQNSPAVKIILENYLKPLEKKGIDTLILGCTHYGIFENQIKKIVGPNVNIISETKIISKKLKNYFERHPEIEKKISRNSGVKLGQGIINFYSTDLTKKFILLGSKFFGKKITAKKISL